MNKILSSSIVACLLLGIQVACVDQTVKKAPRAVRGIIDLSGWDLERDGQIRLQGDWEFYWNKLVMPQDIVNYRLEREHMRYLPVPEIWNSYIDVNDAVGAYGYASYLLQVKGLPRDKNLSLYLLDTGTAHRVYVVPAGTDANDIAPLMSNGVVDVSAKKYVPQYMPVTERFNSVSDSAYIIVQVANFVHRMGGFWRPLVLGVEKEINRSNSRELVIMFFTFGVIIIMAFHYFIIYIQRRKDRSSIYFSLFCLIVGVRLFFTERLLQLWFIPEPSAIIYEISNKFEYISIYLSLSVFYSFLRTVYPDEFPARIEKIVWAVSLLFTAITMAVTISVYSHLILAFELFMVIIGLYGFVGLVRAAIHRRTGSVASIIGFSILFVSLLNDILSANEIIKTPYLVPFGLLAFIFTQSLLLSIKFNNAFQHAENLNVSLTRFVPKDFISYLGKKSILDVNLGDSIESEMAILFTDIRSFTSLSESMTPEENFKFLNSYLTRVGPVIRKNNGFIDKYLADGIMGLFPQSAEDALVCALEMQREVREYNLHRSQMGYQAIQIGTGIHTGRLMLGTIGEKERIDGTVIADAVNLASRLEGLNKKFGTSIIISNKILENLPDASKYDFRMLGKVRVEGKKQPVSVFEIFSNEAESVIELKVKTKSEFEKGIMYYINKNVEDAYTIFYSIYKQNPEDRANIYYLKKAKYYKKYGFPEDWEVAEIILK